MMTLDLSVRQGEPGSTQALSQGVFFSLGARCSWNLSFGEVASFVTQGLLCLVLLSSVSWSPSCINQAEGLLSV